MKNIYLRELNEHMEVVAQLTGLVDKVVAVSERISYAMDQGGKLLICGNGGSAADAQHIAAEFVGRFRADRKPLPAMSLTTDSSVLTCISNDYSFGAVFRRQIEALGKHGDVLLAISTSGNSENVIEAVRAANDKQIFTVGLLGTDGGKLNSLVNSAILVNSENTARIQEAHIFVGHMLCALVEGSVSLD